jgi:hypothetical protein
MFANPTWKYAEERSIPGVAVSAEEALGELATGAFAIVV